MRFGFAVQTKGLGSSFVSATKRSIAALRSSTDRNTPRLRRRLVSLAVPAALTEDAYTAVYCLTAAMFFLECTIGPSWAVPMDVGGEHFGTVSGMMNMAGNIGGALSPIVFGVLVQFGSWQAPFIVAASLLIVGAAVWAFWLDPDASVVATYKIPIAANAAPG